ncbi:lysis system o-spanin lipoprotein Rz1 [Pantoea agglomerans]|uniref:lysis system o-spanin lipoprotein Rz1 n=1 Tax=Enterobacter agglomerans TaxID=549 RepID=UPI0009041D19|nr:lysis system o-spanin lipoprotein Rz1 [Pantoea agglomerans]
MLKPLSISCMMMLLLASAGCSSTQHAQSNPPPAPPAWMMQPAPDLLTPLNGIISPSESESKSPETK